ncbi:hypothetical protein [Sphingomonas crocodyli]|uniref:Invasion associated locus B family protein n=1 Tax=Sphingomonas crocodyli TaxID=1979270 RepID=A0A437M558_9SPHN|nr:hypothetical protein [Sphingomonas crocodyli]RVT92860.1 hypothetical protein EOD43_02800 [Sphingomonas crocodyli]
MAKGLWLAGALAPLLIAAQKPATDAAPVAPTQQITVGDWVVTPSKKWAVASTKNPSGSAFGVMCGPVCFAFLNPQKACDKGASYPAMMNSKAGAVLLELKCDIVDGDHFLTMPLNDVLIDTFEMGGDVRFAIPTSTGTFNISKFSLIGALTATSNIAKLTEQPEDNGPDPKKFSL